MGYFFTDKNYLICTSILLLVASSVIAEENTLASNAYALNMPAIDTLVVQGYRVNPLGETLSASEGVIGSAEIAKRPVLRTGEMLEFISGHAYRASQMKV